MLNVIHSEEQELSNVLDVQALIYLACSESCLSHTLCECEKRARGEDGL